MLQLVYISSVPKSVDHTDLAAMLTISRRNNKRDDITGVLVHDGVRFLQALEGPEDAVEAAYARIKGDARHRGPVIVSRKNVNERHFGDWDMACESVDRRVSDSTIVDLVDRLVAAVPDANTRALFSGFARTDRKVA